MVGPNDRISQLDFKNPWYVDDHFSKQYYRRGPRAVIERRWEVFENAIEDFFINSHLSKPSIPAKVLDAGCGDGINLLGLNNIARRRSWNISIYGSDHNPIRLERAAKFSFVKGTIRSSLDATPYADNWFDVVLCNHVIEHIPQDKKVLLELKRIIRPGGLFILGVPNEGCALAQLRNHIIQPCLLKSTDHVNFYTEKSLSNLIKNSGFLISKLKKAGFFLPHLGLNLLISNTKVGQVLLNTLGHIFPSQSADLIIISNKI